MHAGNRIEHFFILGAAKCGTTSLFSYLAQHPSVVMSDPKEPRFFEAEYEKGLDYYAGTYFRHWNGERFAGDARHRNLYLPYVPHRLQEAFPRAKLIVILRNPVSRAYSHYLHRLRHYNETLPFDEALAADLERIERERGLSPEEIERNYRAHLDRGGWNSYYTTILDSGYYAQQIERYLEHFDRTQLLILFLDDLRAEPSRVYSNLLGFLDDSLAGIEVDLHIPNRRPNKLRAHVNRVRRAYPGLRRAVRAVVPRRIRSRAARAIDYLDTMTPAHEGRMSSETESWLVEHYREHNARLEDLTGRDLSRWSASAS